MIGARTTRLDPNELEGRAKTLRDTGGRIQFAYAWWLDRQTPEVRYVSAVPGQHDFEMWVVSGHRELPTLTSVFPLVGWYEREMMDLQHLSFTGHPEPYPLILNLEPDPLADAGEGAPDPKPNGRAPLPDLDATDVQHLPFGPIRADVVESAEFTFLYVGEHILHYQPRLFFKHRGMERRFEGTSLRTGAVIAERVSGVGSVAHALAYCEAVERALGCEVPVRARLLRVLLAELERLYNHLHYLGHLCHTTTLKVGEAQGKLLEETVKQLNARLTGSRFLRSIMAPGGLRRDLDPGPWLADALDKLRVDFAAYADRLEASASHLDRLMTTGPLPERVAFDQGATGPIERASGLDRDLRRDHPYALYDDLPVAVPSRQEGDAYARERVRMAEVEASLDLCQRVLQMLRPGPIHAECAPVPLAEGLGWAEGARGSLFYAVHLGADGRLARVKVKSPSFSNWRAFPFTVHDSNLMDYGINEASFGLTMAGCDR